MGADAPSPSQSHGLKSHLDDSFQQPHILHSQMSPTSSSHKLSCLLQHVLDEEALCAELVSDGQIRSKAVEQRLQARLDSIAQDADAMYEPTSDQQASGRIGPAKLFLHRQSAVGDVSIVGLRIESLSNFSSARAGTAVFKGAWMYEVTLGTCGIQQIGWATLRCPFNNEEGVGDAADSYAWDGKRVQRWNVTNAPYGTPWAAGDVIGVCLDLEKGELTFVKNGVNMGVAFDNVRRFGKGLAYFPALSISHGEHCTLNFGATPFQYPQPGFAPLQDPPRPSVSAQATYLLGALLRLAEGSPPPPPGSLPLQPDSPPRALSSAEVTVLGGQLGARLAPLLEQPYVVGDVLLPHIIGTLRKSKGTEYSASVHALGLALRLVALASEPEELKVCYRSVWEQLARLARTAMFDPADMRLSGAYWPLTAACFLLRLQHARDAWVSTCDTSHRVFFRQVEAFLARKQPTSRELRALIPKVWFPGAERHTEDERIDEAAYKEAAAALGDAVLSIERRQLELCELLHDVPLTGDSSVAGRRVSSVFAAFVEYLTKKNIGMVRNVQPPGLSDSTVLLTTYFALLHIVGPHIEANEANGGVGIFAAGDLFCKGLSREGLHKDRYWGGMQRLGGTLSHLLKEVPVADLDLSPVSVPLSPPSPSQSAARPPKHAMSWEQAGELMDRAMLVYRLGAFPAFAGARYQEHGQEASRAQLADVGRRLAEVQAPDAEAAPDYSRHLGEAQQVFRDDVVESTRVCAWLNACLYKGWKPQAMFLVSTHLVRVLLAISKRGPLLQYVPEFYVEALVDAFSALKLAQGASGAAPLGAIQPLLPRGLQDVVTFLVLHFHDSRIVNPDVRDELLQAVSKLLQTKDFVAAFEQNEVAQQKLMVSLLAAFDARSWVSISGILLRLTRGGGFGQLPSTSMEGTSLLFRQLLRDACVQHGAVFDAFLNRLFNTLNWTVTEFIVVLKEVHDAQVAGRQADPQAHRRCALMFELSNNLERLLEFLAAQLPQAFRAGSNLNLTRLVELLSFILSHTSGSGATLLDQTMAMKLPALQKVNRQTLLAPLVGTLATLFAVERRESEDSGHSIAGAMAAAETCPIGALEHAADLEWKPQTPGNEAAYADAEVFRDFVAVVKDLRAQEAARADADAEASTEAPDEFLDPLLSTIMQDPVILPDSKITVDRTTIERHLMSSKTDPFNRSPLTLDAIKPDTDLKARIDEWKAARSK